MFFLRSAPVFSKRLPSQGNSSKGFNSNFLMFFLRFAPIISLGLAYLGNSSIGFNSDSLPEVTAFSSVPSIGIYTTGPFSYLSYLTKDYYYLFDSMYPYNVPYPVCKHSAKYSHRSFFTKGRFTLYSDGRCLHVLQFFSSSH